jgi:hypothetical protein
MPDPITPDDLERWRRTRTPASAMDLVPRLMAEIERLWAEVKTGRADAMEKAASALEKRLSEVAAYNHGGCPTCRDAEARAFLARLRKAAGLRAR